MVKMTFHNQADISDELLKYAVIVAYYKGKYIFCRHKQRTKWEIPSGHREPGENILDTAKRKLHEETGATGFDIKPVCVYGVARDDETAYGLLCFAEVTVIGELSQEMEIGEIRLFDTLPENLTYPSIQSHLFEKIKSHKSIKAHVNSYLEFMNAILLTSNYNEITKPIIGYGLMTEDKNEYTDAIKKHLIPYKDEPIYRIIEEMIPNGFTFSRPVELMLSLGNSNDFTMIFQPSELCVQYCGGMKQIKKLLMMLREFEKKTAFFTFFDSVKDFYIPVIEKVSLSLSSYPFIELIEEQFGTHQNSYNYILSSLMVGNFGIEFHQKGSTSSDLFSVFATDNFSLSPGILFHEYSHSFINPLTDKYFNDVLKYSNVYTKLEKYKLPDYQSGYGDYKECINEHFVRAMAIHLLKKINCSMEADMLLNNDLHCGYKFIPEILKAYDYYDANRNTFRNFECFYPELLKVFNKKIKMI